MTYNGSTNDPVRRLRQHNEEISGGAKFTHGKGGAWEIYALMTGFTDHINTLSCEWRIKHPSGKPGPRDKKYCGVAGRIKSLNEVLPLERWTKQCTINNRDCKYTLYLAEDVAQYIDNNDNDNDNNHNNIIINAVAKIDKEFLTNLAREQKLSQNK